VLAYLSGERQIEERRLGSGTDGEVYIVNGPSAVKVHYDRHRFLNELHAYQVLSRIGLEHIGEFRIPVFRQYDDQLLIIEMSVVKPPYLIDFGKATIGKGQDWSDEHMAYWWEQVEDKFENDFAVASQIFEQLVRRTNIYQWDLNPSNLNFGPISNNDEE